MHWEAKNLCLTVLQYSLCCGGLPCPQYPWGMPVLVVAIGGLRVCTISYTWDWPQFGEEVPHLEELRPTLRNTVEAAVFTPTSGYFACNNFFSSSSLTGSKVEDRLLTIQFDQHFHYWLQRLLSDLLNLPLSVFHHSCSKLPYNSLA